MISLIKRLWGITFLRFLAIGGVNTAFGYGMYATMILLGLNYALAALVAQICGVLFNFKTTGVIVFRNKNNWLLFRFVFVYVATYAVTVGALRGLTSLGLNDLVAGAIIVMPMALTSFVLLRAFVFREKRDEVPQT